ncbi:hypothetical protein M2336_001698 [Sphingobium sp. B1D7B]|uniref:DUF7666 domain-containing protein n=1 Tax=Sphingobium sp. B1D7B TaxID=2940578 RepID=UPI0022247C3A|nr:hypothetical protein [Sphingobium sp. B1D7B]MCW2405069.1 hypothetical protein [Sphingobium sp. B1D7B]
MATRKKAEPAGEQIVAYKGFDKNLQCRGYQYEVGKTYVHTGPVVRCQSGFHVCQNPLDVLDFYGLEDGNRFARVTVGGKVDRSEDKKWACAELTVEVELKLPDLIASAIKWVMDACTVSGDKVQSASGDYSQLAASGHSSKLAASGHSSKLAASGHSSQLAASGHSSKLAASGHSSKLAASGHSSKLAASGDYSQLAASGHSSKLAASGHSSKLAASGHSSKLAASGDYSKLAASGHSSVISASAPNCLAKGVDGTWIALPEFGRDGKCIGFATGCIGKDGLKADIFYRAQGGKLVEAA